MNLKEDEEHCFLWVVGLTENMVLRFGLQVNSAKLHCHHNLFKLLSLSSINILVANQSLHQLKHV